MSVEKLHTTPAWQNLTSMQIIAKPILLRALPGWHNVIWKEIGGIYTHALKHAHAHANIHSANTHMRKHMHVETYFTTHNPSVTKSHVEGNPVEILAVMCGTVVLGECSGAVVCEIIVM